ncbi:D-alanyl-D-alanine carboxypeptidase family protein [Fredinandcohnia humi]
MKQLFTVLLLPIIFTTLLPLSVFAEDENQITAPSLQSEAAILLDANTGSILYEKNSETKMYPASLTKMATAIYAIENGNLNDIVTVSKEAWEAEGTRVYLEEGEQVPLKNLIQGLLINSGNDAGVAIAEHMDGNVEDFAKSINKYLKEKIRIDHTNFENPHGLFDDNHYTTAYDLAVLTQYALKNEIFSEIFNTKELPWNGAGWQTTLYSHHLLVRGEIPYEGIIGGKTGFVQESRFTLSTAAEQGDLKLIAIVLKANTDNIAYEDTVALLDYGFENFEVSEVSEVSANRSFTSASNSDETFRLNQPLPYTHKKDEAIEIDVDDKGMLTVIGDDGRHLASKELTQDIPQEAMSARAQLEAIEVNKSKNLTPIVMIALAAIVVTVALYYRRKLNKANI